MKAQLSPLHLLLLCPFLLPSIYMALSTSLARLHTCLLFQGALRQFRIQIDRSTRVLKDIAYLMSGRENICTKLPPPDMERDEQDCVPASGGTSLSKVEESDDPGAAEVPAVVQDDPEGVEPLLVDLMDDILGRLPMLQVLQLRPHLGKALRNSTHRPAFRENRPISEGEFSPMYFTTDAKGDLHWHGFDTKLKEWTPLPSLDFLPSPNPGLLNGYLMAGDGGLLCMNVGKASGREKLVICNPLTRTAKVLPGLIHARHPVLMHLKVVEKDSGHYQVIVAGSAGSGQEELSLRTEVYESKTGVWECPVGSDLPCASFGLNEYQNGAYFSDGQRQLLMCVAIVDATLRRGVLVYDISKKKWASGSHEEPLYIPLIGPLGAEVSLLDNIQIVESGGAVYVFSEQECREDVYFVIHKVIPKTCICCTLHFTFRRVTKRKRAGGRNLLM